jgi:hypothetical protein
VEVIEALARGASISADANAVFEHLAECAQCQRLYETAADDPPPMPPPLIPGYRFVAEVGRGGMRSFRRAVSSRPC